MKGALRQKTDLELVMGGVAVGVHTACELIRRGLAVRDHGETWYVAGPQRRVVRRGGCYRSYTICMSGVANRIAASQGWTRKGRRAHAAWDPKYDKLLGL